VISFICHNSNHENKINNLLALLKIEAVPQSIAIFENEQSFTLHKNGQQIGIMGLISFEKIKTFNIKNIKAVFVAEIDFSKVND